MSFLDKNHPFRESVTRSGDSTQSSSSGESTASPSAEGAEGKSHNVQKTIFASLSPKVKLSLFLFVAAIVCYGYVSAYDSLYPQSEQEKQLSATEVAMANRSVEDARRSAGLFGRLFCRGMQRSSFCR